MVQHFLTVKKKEKEKTAEDLAHEELWTLWYCSLPLSFPLYKSSLFLLHWSTYTWLTVSADPELQFSADLE